MGETRGGDRLIQSRRREVEFPEVELLMHVGGTCPAAAEMGWGFRAPAARPKGTAASTTPPIRVVGASMAVGMHCGEYQSIEQRMHDPPIGDASCRLSPSLADASCVLAAAAARLYFV